MGNISTAPTLIPNWLKRKYQLYRLRRLVTSDSPPSGWYQQRKRAEREIQAISDGQLVLAPYQLFYHGDDRQHLVAHKKCGNAFKLSLSQLQLEGPTHICPYCHGGDLTRIGTPEDINAYIFKISDEQVVFIRNQHIGCSDGVHAFYHLACHQPFQARFDHVQHQNLSGTGSGCPHCR